MNNTCYLSREPVSVMPGWKVGESGALMIAKERQEYLRPTTLQRTNLSFSSSERFHNSLVQVQVSRAPVIVDIRRKNHSQIEDRAVNPFSDEGPDSREILVIDLDVDRSGHCPRSPTRPCKRDTCGRLCRDQRRRNYPNSTSEHVTTTQPHVSCSFDLHPSQRHYHER